MLKPFKLTYFSLAVGIFILTFCTLFGASIAYKYSDIGGLNKTNKLTVNLLNNEESRGNSAFTQDDIIHLQQFPFKDIDFSYGTEHKTITAYENNQTETNVFGIDDKYSQFHQIQMKSGSFITSGNKDEKVAVVDENLALKLFNNTKVIGMHIELYNQEFRIIGVIEQEEAILQVLTDNGLGSIYIPIDYMLQYYDKANITSLEISADSKGTTGENIKAVKDALTTINKAAADYKITDYNIENKFMEEIVQFGTFIPGVVIILLLMGLIRGKALELFTTVSSELKTKYIREVIRLSFLRLSLLLLEGFALLALMYLVWRTIRFNIYIPPEYIPEELIDLAFFKETLKGLLQNNVLNAAYAPSLAEMKLNVLPSMQKWNLGVYIFVGYPLYCLGLKLLGKNQKNVLKHLLFCSVCLISSIILSLLILFIIHMPITVNTEGVLVIFGLIFLTVYHIDLCFHTRSEASIKY